MLRIKVWSSDRLKKCIIAFTGENAINEIITKANQKLRLNGKILVAEDDGTSILEDDDILYYVEKEKPILLLEDNQF